MNYLMTEDEIAFSDALNPRQLLSRMGFADQAIVEDGGSLRVYCPIHKDQVIRSLIIEKEKNTFRCQYKSCPAHAGGRLIELLATYLGIAVPEAIAQFQEDPHPERTLTKRADQAIESGNMVEARQLLEEAVRLSPRHEVTRCKLAALFLELGEREKGFAEYLTAAEDFAVKNQIDKTLSIYNILVMLSPQDARVRRQMALLFSRLGRAKEAAEHLKWVTDQLLSRGQTPEAIRTVREILALVPDEPGIHMLLAKLLSQTRLINDAVAEAEVAANLAFEQGDRRVLEEAITFGLIYRPDNERLRELEAGLRETPARAEVRGESNAQENEFNDWLGSLEEEVATVKQPGPAKAAAPAASRAPSDSAIRREKWLTFCRNNLIDLDGDKLDSMGQHLLSMFKDAEESFNEGALSEWELNVLREFYTSFCLAYEQVRKAHSS